MVETLFWTSMTLWAVLGIVLLATVVMRLVNHPKRVRAEARETAAHAAWITQLKEDQP